MKTIAVAGATEHIGTTTQAIQLVLYLIKEESKKTCYLELNHTKYLESLNKVCEGVTNNILNMNYSGISMYKRNFAKTINPGNWDCVVKDYGNAYDEYFDLESFKKQDIKVLVCGSKPNEIFQTQDLLMNEAFDDVYIVFSFVPEIEKISLLSLMGNRSKRTVFSDIILNPYKCMENHGLFNLISQHLNEKEKRA